MISELPEYGIDTSKWEYLHGDCCYGGAMEFISRCIKGASEPAEELQEEVERLRDVADAAYTLLSCVPIEGGNLFLGGFDAALADWKRLNYKPKQALNQK